MRNKDTAKKNREDDLKESFSKDLIMEDVIGWMIAIILLLIMVLGIWQLFS